MSTYTVVVALHIIAVIAAYGLPLSAPLLVPYVRRHHPTALPGLHAAQHRLDNVLTGPATVLLLGFGITSRPTASCGTSRSSGSASPRS